MRRLTFSTISALLLLILPSNGHTQATTLTANLSLGSSGPQVTLLQQILNKDPETRIAATGQGSPGNETGYFGSLTKEALIRFQAKYAQEVLIPAGLTTGTGYAGSYTRAKLNALTVTATTPASAASATSQGDSSVKYLVSDKEKIDIYAGDKMISDIRNKFLSTINAAVSSQTTASITPPTILPTDAPSVLIQGISPKTGAPGARITITGSGILSNTVLYLGSSYLIRSLERNLSGDFSFVVPPVPAGRYDLALRTGAAVSNTTPFVISNPKNPPVHIESVSPATIPYGETLTITGTGFSPQGNSVVTTYQKISNVSSVDGKTLTVQVTPDSLTETAKIGDKSRKIPMSVYIINDYGFSDTTKSFTMSI